MWQISGTFTVEIQWWLPVVLYILIGALSYHRFGAFMKELFGKPFTKAGRVRLRFELVVMSMFWPLSWLIWTIVWVCFCIAFAISEMTKGRK